MRTVKKKGPVDRRVIQERKEKRMGRDGIIKTGKGIRSVVRFVECD